MKVRSPKPNHQLQQQTTMLLTVVFCLANNPTASQTTTDSSRRIRAPKKTTNISTIATMIEPRSTIMVVKQHNQRQREERAIVLQPILDRQVSPLAILNPSSKCSIRTHVNKSKKRPSLIPSLRPHRLLVSLPSNSSTRGRLTLCSTDSKTNTQRYQLRNPRANNSLKTVQTLNIKHRAATSL